MEETQWSDDLDHKGGKQLMPKQWKKLFETIDTYGILSDQPSETQITDLGDGAELIYFPEVRKEALKPYEYGGRKMVGLLDRIYFIHNGNSELKKILDSGGEHPEGGKLNILLVGVNYPANPSLIFPDMLGSYLISTAGYEQQMTKVDNLGRSTISHSPHTMKKRITPKELDRLVDDAMYLFKTPIKYLKQSGKDAWSYTDNRYYTGQKEHEGITYGQGFFVDRWFTDKEMKKLGWEPQTIQERMINILNETFDTNGHIFFVIGKQRILRKSFDSINNRVIN
jgi:hypothetical protein